LACQTLVLINLPALPGVLSLPCLRRELHSGPPKELPVPRTPRLVPTRMDPSYGITGDAEGASWSVTEQKLAASRNYWICTTRADGAPHSKPVWGFWSNGALWFGSGGVAGRNLQR